MDTEGFGDKYWVFFSGDKGGGIMKFHLEIINLSEQGKGTDKEHLYCMYSGVDSEENLWKVWEPAYHKQVHIFLSIFSYTYTV